MGMQKLCGWLLYKKMGWKKNVTEQHPQKYIICLAPHTSNWDFFIGQLYMRAEGFHANFLMKKEWFFWPLGIIARKIGGIPVQRSKQTGMTEQLIEEARKRESFVLTITPEGTRSYNPNWKRGFYYIASGAGIPIMLYAVDFQKKTITCTRKFIPTGDVENDMKEIKAYYKGCKGKHPEKFAE